MGISENLKRGVTELARLCLLSQRGFRGILRGSGVWKDGYTGLKA